MDNLNINSTEPAIFTPAYENSVSGISNGNKRSFDDMMQESYDVKDVSIYETYFATLRKHLKLSENFNINTLTPDDLSIFYSAIKQEDVEAIALLIQLGADGNVKDKNGDTPLHLAVMKNLKILNMLIAIPGIDLNIKNQDGITPFELAAKIGNLEAAQLLLEQERTDVNGQTKNDQTAWHVAIKKSTAIIVLLYNSGRIKENAFLIAARDGDIDAVEQYIEKGCNVNALYYDSKSKDNESRWLTIGQAAIEYGRIEVFKTLIEKAKDLDINAKNVTNGRSMGYYAIEENQMDIFKLLLEQKEFDCNIQAWAGVGLLHLAAYRGTVDAVKLLLNRPDLLINMLTREKMTALYLATLDEQDKIVALLLAHAKIDSNLGINEWTSPLIVAVCRVSTWSGRTYLVDRTNYSNIINIMQLLQHKQTDVHKKTHSVVIDPDLYISSHDLIMDYLEPGSNEERAEDIKKIKLLSSEKANSSI